MPTDDTSFDWLDQPTIAELVRDEILERIRVEERERLFDFGIDVRGSRVVRFHYFDLDLPTDRDVGLAELAYERVLLGEPSR